MSSMNTVPRQSFDGFTPLHDAVSCFMEGGVLGPERAVFLLGRTFPVDILETPEEYMIEGTLFGIRPESIQITTSGNTLTIRTGSNARERDIGEIHLRRGRIDGIVPAVGRTITLPGHINPDKVSAEFDHGVLSIHVGKDDQVKEHKIPLRVNT
jgi:HSP20 family protein